MDDTNSLIPQRKSRLALLRILLLAVACVFAAGCFETKQEFTLNPDGSGKAVIESSFTPTAWLINTGEQDPEKSARDAIRKVIEEAEGADAWQDVSYRELDDGRLRFKGTVYFPELAKLKIGPTAFWRYTMTNDQMGNLVITPVASEIPPPYAGLRTNVPVTAEAIRLARRQFRSAKPLLAVLFGSMKQETVFHLPGVVRHASNFETNSPRTLRIRFDGARYLEAIEERLLDARLTEEAAKAAADGFSVGDLLLNEKLYGERSPVRAVIKPGEQPLFDYAAELAEAQAAFPRLASLLDLDAAPRPQPKPAVEGEPATTTVTGIRWNFDGAERRGWADWAGPGGYTLSLRAELPGTVLSVNKVLVSRALTLEGVSLLRNQPSAHEFSNARLSPDWTQAHFEVRLNSPPRDSQGITELSGLLECTSAEHQRSVELVSGKLRGGVKGAEFGVQIDDIRSHLGGGEQMTLRVRLSPEQLRSLKAIGEGGLAVRLESRGRTQFGEDHIYTFVASRAIPRSGKLVAEVLLGSRTVRIPFSITNITLLGQRQPPK
ncbi:MAG: hypothetical protein KIS67_03810 [Verrucomicrobiae bacterium]|nr:hypothetical protein [Verrucomicrobiae bacterium]